MIKTVRRIYFKYKEAKKESKARKNKIDFDAHALTVNEGKGHFYVLLDFWISHEFLFEKTFHEGRKNHYSLLCQKKFYGKSNIVIENLI